MTSTDLAVFNNSRAEAANYRERTFIAERSLPVKLYDNTFGLGRHILGSALFGIKRGERKHVAVKLPTYRGAAVEYSGPELRQDDATVFIGLVHKTRTGMVSDCIEFDPREFVVSIGWDNHKKSIEKLRACVERMQTAMVKLVVNDSGLRTHLVGAFEWSSTTWAVSLDVRVVELFNGGTTFLPRAERVQLTDGLQTWLAGFLRAQSDECIFDIADLLRFSGSEAELKTFGTQVRETMGKLKAVGVVEDFSFGRGKLRIER